MCSRIEAMVTDFEKGIITRRELIAALAALSVAPALSRAQEPASAAGPIPVSGVDHLAFRVSNLARSTAFYQEHLGGRIRSRSSNSVFLDIGDHWLALFALGAVSTGFEVTEKGVDHISFHSIKHRTLDERMGALAERGLNPVSPPGSGRVYFRDPDGIILQLS
jgi:catechol 2,3-dioxygenase-like lactoylglutathione lyase family enzyme